MGKKQVPEDSSLITTSPEMASFLQNIRNHRLDDAPRLIFADWLEEKGDPRAELVRISCQLQDTEIYHERYPELYRRREELIEPLYRAWFGADRDRLT